MSFFFVASNFVLNTPLKVIFRSWRMDFPGFIVTCMEDWRMPFRWDTNKQFIQDIFTYTKENVQSRECLQTSFRLQKVSDYRQFYCYCWCYIYLTICIRFVLSRWNFGMQWCVIRSSGVEFKWIYLYSICNDRQYVYIYQLLYITATCIKKKTQLHRDTT